MNIITLNDKKYPKLLKKIGKAAPKQLYYKGAWDENIFENCLAVVGSRQMTSYGKRAVEQIVTEAAASGITIVSGFMYGVDAMAHQAALNAGGKTIAVMPCGIDLIHPEYQQDLYSEILNNNGLVISEYEGTMQPANWTYPKRNRIVAGLSKACLVVEAGEKSGSLITASFAKKYKRKIFAVPGQIFSENSKGIFQLIKEGAKMLTSAKEILNFFNITGALCFPGASTKGGSTKLKIDGVEGKILAHLKNEPLEVDVLARDFNLPVAEVGTILSLMQLKGFICQEGNKYRPNN